MSEKQSEKYGTTHLRDYGDVIKHSSHGAIGTLIVEPIGTTQTLVGNSNATADVRNNNVDTVLFREFVLNYQDDVTMQNNAGKAMKNNAAGEDTEDSGMKAFNYKTEPIWARLGLPPETDLRTLGDQIYTNTLSSWFPNSGCISQPCDPRTPLFTAKAGTNVASESSKRQGTRGNTGLPSSAITGTSSRGLRTRPCRARIPSRSK